jgi:hypothetical protein
VILTDQMTLIMIGKKSVCASRMEVIGVNRQAGDVRRTTRWSSIQLEGACRALAVQVSLVVVPPLLHIPAAHLQVQSRLVKWVCVGEVMASFDAGPPATTTSWLVSQLNS